MERKRRPSGEPLDRHSILDREIDRRTAMVNGVLGAATIGLEGYVTGRSPLGALIDIFTGKPKERGPLHENPFENPFASPEANEVAKRLGITAGNFWMTEPAVMTTITASSKKDGYLKQKELLPIFPNAVLAQSEAIVKASVELGIPPNVGATIASIESAGRLDADSGIANGLAQVVPHFHFDKIVQVAEEAGHPIPDAQSLLRRWKLSIANGGMPSSREFVNTSETIEALQDPYIGVKVGMMVLKDYYGKLLQEKPNLDPDSPVAWAWALGAYNGGTKNYAKSYQQIALESQLYTVHGIRYLMTAEIAAQMRNKGMSDPEIARGLVSTEIDARGYAHLMTKPDKLETIDDYEHLWAPLSQQDFSYPPGYTERTKRDTDPNVTEQLKKYYDEHISGAHSFEFPYISPGLRIWLVNGGGGLFEQSSANLEKDLYPANK